MLWDESRRMESSVLLLNIQVISAYPSKHIKSTLRDTSVLVYKNERNFKIDDIKWLTSLFILLNIGKGRQVNL